MSALPREHIYYGLHMSMAVAPNMYLLLGTLSSAWGTNLHLHPLAR